MPEAFEKNRNSWSGIRRVTRGGISRLMPDRRPRQGGRFPVRVKVGRCHRDEEGVYLKPGHGVIVSFKTNVGQAVPDSSVSGTA